MIYIETNSVKPYVNLAYEEYFLKNQHLNLEPVFMLWRNEPTVVVGRFQNTINEVNRDFVNEKKINVIRRITGGGAVYHDLGTLCYTFIFRKLSPKEVSFSTFALPMLKALSEVGVKGELSGRNDITIDGAKFSGTAMSLHKNSLLFHGTILYDTDLTVLNSALNVREEKLQAKGIKSVKSRVTNILPHVNKPLSIEIFKNTLKQAVAQDMPFKEYIPTFDDIKNINKLSEDKYKNWEWNYGQDPKATFCNRKRFNGGEIEVYLVLENGKIKNCKIYGDFLGLKDIETVEQKLVDQPYEPNNIRKILKSIDMQSHFGTIQEDELLQCMFDSL